MKKTFLTILVACMSLAVSAQMYLWKNGEKFDTYAISDVDSITFTAPNTGEVKPDALTGVFSVSASKKVQFSKGNVQYSPATKEWRFAANQWDIETNTSFKSGWISLFGYSTAETYYGVSESDSYSNYEGDFVDWGENFDGGWYTLSMEEWVYLIAERADASKLKSLARVAGVDGLILLPDGFINPGVEYIPTDDGYDVNVYSFQDWEKLESAGAVFLPNNGWRIGSRIDYLQDRGYYACSTFQSTGSAFVFYSHAGKIDVSYTYRHYGMSVRLVKEAN